MNKQCNALAGNCSFGYNTMSETVAMVYVQPIKWLGRHISRSQSSSSAKCLRHLEYPSIAFTYLLKMRNNKYRGALLRLDAHHLDAERNLGIIFRSIDRSHYKTP